MRRRAATTRATGSRGGGGRRSEQAGIRDSGFGIRNSESLRIAVHVAAAASGVQSGNTATERDPTRLALDLPNPQSRIPNPGPQMRELILLRHAHAEPPATGPSDLDRPLSAEGHAERSEERRGGKEGGRKGK